MNAQTLAIAVLVLLAGCSGLAGDDTRPVEVENSVAGYCALNVSVHTDEPVKLYSDYTNSYVEPDDSRAIIEATPGGYVRAEYWRNGSTIWNASVGEGCAVTVP